MDEITMLDIDSSERGGGGRGGRGGRGGGRGRGRGRGGRGSDLQEERRNKKETANYNIRSSIAPGGPSRLNQLARVEVQSIMRFLDATSIIHFARCNQSLYTDASSVHAWSDEAMIPMKWTQPTLLQQDQPHLVAFGANRLLRHAALFIRIELYDRAEETRKQREECKKEQEEEAKREQQIMNGEIPPDDGVWHPPEDEPIDEVKEAEEAALVERASEGMARILCCPELKRVRHLEIDTHSYNKGFGQKQWNHLFERAHAKNALQLLSRLILEPESLVSDLVAPLIHLPRLTSLKLPSRQVSDGLIVLPHLKHLTSLELRDWAQSGDDFVSCLPAISACQNLRDLTIYSSWSDTKVLEFIKQSSTNWQHLHTLYLCAEKSRQDSEVDLEEYALALKSLPSLTSLHVWGPRPAGLLSVAHHAPRLSSITFHLQGITLHLDDLPPFDLVAKLHPRLHCVIIVVVDCENFACFLPQRGRGMRKYKRHWNVTLEYHYTDLQKSHLGEAVIERWSRGEKQYVDLQETMKPWRPRRSKEE